MIQVKHVTITHKKDDKILLEDFNLTLNDGDKAVIIGEEGNGKSTLLKWICQPEQIADYCEAVGERLIRSHRIGYLPQELPAADREKCIYEYFLEEPLFLEQDAKELSRMAAAFGLSSDFFYLEQPMGTLSGGEKVKAQLLRLLLSAPDVLLLDEPSNDIDLETLEWLEAFLLGWERIVLYISHDETLIRHTATIIIHLEQLQKKTTCRYTVARLPYEQYIKERSSQFENQARMAANDRREQKLRNEKYQRIRQSVDHAQASITRQNPAKGRLLKKKMHAVKSMERRFAREDAAMTQMPEEETAIFFKLGGEASKIPSGKTVLDYHLKTLRAPDHKTVLADSIRLFIRGPQKICIIGPNGAGKTTLLREIAKDLLGRTDIHAAYMPQNYEELLDPAITPIDFLDRTNDKKTRTDIRTWLGAIKFTADEMEHTISQLSGGQKAKLFLLKLSLSGADVLLLDEPTRNFSPLSGPVIRRMLKNFEGAMISISHDRNYIREVCDKVYRLTARGLVEVTATVQAGLRVSRADRVKIQRMPVSSPSRSDFQ